MFIKSGVNNISSYIGNKYKTDIKMNKKISLDIKENQLNLIDKACQRDCRTRTNFLIKASLDRAEEILKEDLE